MGKIRDNEKNNGKERQEGLEDIRMKIVDKLTEGKITESQYDILNNKISEYLGKLDET